MPFLVYSADTLKLFVVWKDRRTQTKTVYNEEKSCSHQQSVHILCSPFRGMVRVNIGIIPFGGVFFLHSFRSFSLFQKMQFQRSTMQWFKWLTWDSSTLYGCNLWNMNRNRLILAVKWIHTGCQPLAQYHVVALHARMYRTSHKWDEKQMNVNSFSYKTFDISLLPFLGLVLK